MSVYKSVNRVAHNPLERLFGIPSVSNHQSGRHSLIGSPLRFTDAISLLATGNRRCSTFPCSTSQLTELNQ
jgi:hypothetical protein